MAKVPPHNADAELQVLGALLLDPEGIAKIADILHPDDFYTRIHGDIYQSMLELFEKREPIDVLSVTNRLKEKQLLDQIGGHGFVTSLADQVGTASHIAHHAGIIQKKATLRRLQQAASEINEYSFTEEDEIDSILDKSEKILFEVSQKYLKKNFIPIRTILTETFDRIDQLHREGGKIRGLPSGFPDLDNVLAGFQKSDLIILAARP